MTIFISIVLTVAVLASVKWFAYFHALCGAIHYMEINNITPTEEDLTNATDWAVKNSISSIIEKIKKIF
ncbi:hypothetical protein FDB28_06000 [Clostridium botulinum]|uniref:hypothetical protein n=1 Tax=Clostridium sp. VAP51 TaxID=2949978 RepID=UPI0013FA0DE3|nr:hypothetical protein [Clostridium sp. VAP51]NFN93649.1 hypothetical protein [Clostridium botulinum]NFS95411.1 hypothetical protein [Clostridium botulinum]